MRHHVPLILGQRTGRHVAQDGLRHLGNRAQRVAVAGVQLLGQQHQRLALGQNGIAAGRVRIVHNAHVRHGQAGGRRKLGRRHPHLLGVGAQAALRQLAEYRVLAGLGVAGRRQQAAHVGFELVGDQHIVLFVRHTQNVLLRRCVKLQRNRGVRHGADVVVYQRADGALQAAAAKRLAARGIPDQRLHQRAAHGVGHPLDIPAVLPPAQHCHRVVHVQVHHARLPHAGQMLVRHGVNDRQPTGNAPLLAAPQRCRRSRGVEPYLAADGRVCGQRCERTAVLQLVPAGLAVLGDQPVVRDQPVQHSIVAAAAHKSVKHAAGGQHVHGLLPPTAPDLKVADALRQCDPKVHVLQRNVALVVFFLLGVAGLMQAVDPDKLVQGFLLRPRQPGHRAEIQCDHHILLISRSAFSGSGLVCWSWHPTAPGRRPPPADCCRRRSRTRRRWAA